MVGIPLVEMVLFKHLDFAKCNRSTFHSCSWCSAAAVSTAINAASCSFISDEAYLILAAYPRGSSIQCRVVRFNVAQNLDYVHMLSVAGGILEHSDRLCASHCSSEASLALLKNFMGESSARF